MVGFRAFLDIVLVLLLVLLAGVAAMLVGLGLSGSAVLPLVLVVQGSIILIGVWGLVRWRGLSWGGLRMRSPTLMDLPRGLFALLLFMLVNLVFAAAVSHFRPDWMGAHHEQLGTLGAELTGELSLGLVALMMLFVAFYEELVARGALLARSQALLGGIWLPVLLSSVLFGAGHFYQGWLGVAQTTLAGIVLARLTLYWGTLWPAIIAHAALNTLSLMALKYLVE